MATLHEDPAEFKAFTGLIERTFVPKNLPEYEVVQRLATAIWRRLRLYNAAARWEAETLRQSLGNRSRGREARPSTKRACEPMELWCSS